MYGKTHTESARKRISDAHTGKRVGEDNHFFGKHHSAETEAIISAIRRAKPKLTCVHCARVFDLYNFKRWHGDNCKCKPK